MIQIKEKEFEMVQVKSGPFFNLSLLTTVNAGKENERSEMKLYGYGLPFEVCMQLIVGIKMASKEGTYTVKEYIDKYAEAVNEVSKLIQFIDKVEEPKEEVDE